MKGVLINVGANTQKYPANVGRSGPIFRDGTFRYVPIPEDERFAYRGCPTYRSMDLAEFVPREVRDKPVHHDPEFRTMTFGDYPWGSGHKGNLATLTPGDWLFFLAGLDPYTKSDQGGWIRGEKKGFYVIGYFELEEVVLDTRHLTKPQLARFASNAHLRYSERDANCGLFAGSSHSHLLTRAFPFTRDVAERVLRTSNESPLRWKLKVNGRWQTEMERINSYTRNPQVLDADQVQFLRDSVQPYV